MAWERDKKELLSTFIPNCKESSLSKSTHSKTPESVFERHRRWHCPPNPLPHYRCFLFLHLLFRRWFAPADFVAIVDACNTIVSRQSPSSCRVFRGSIFCSWFDFSSVSLYCISWCYCSCDFPLNSRFVDDVVIPSCSVRGLRSLATRVLRDQKKTDKRYVKDGLPAGWW